jgi:hypothetical protein
MSNIAGLGWLNTNATRNYPISQEADLTPLAGQGYELPDDLILDMQLTVPFDPTVKPFYFYLYSISLSGSNLIVEIGYSGIHQTGDNGTVAAISETIYLTTHTNPMAYTLRGVGKFSGAIGTIAIGNLHYGESPGYILFKNKAYLESTVIVMNTVGVSSISIEPTVLSGTSDISPPTKLTGHILIKPGINFALESGGNNSIVFNAMDGAGLESICTCAGDITLGPCIRTINSLPPNTDGNVDLISGTCITIENQGHSLLISETCSEPCCGCDQLDILVADLRDLQNGFERLDSYITALAGAVESIRSSAFGSVVTNNACGD